MLERTALNLVEADRIHKIFCAEHPEKVEIEAHAFVPRLLKSNDELDLHFSLYAPHVAEIVVAINKNGKQPPAQMAKYSGFLRLKGAMVVREGTRFRVIAKEFVVRSAAITFWNWQP